MHCMLVSHGWSSEFNHIPRHCPIGIISLSSTGSVYLVEQSTATMLILLYTTESHNLYRAAKTLGLRYENALCWDF